MEIFRGFSLLEVKITTGRTHQIRVHLSAIGQPVVGDDVYGERTYKEFVKKFGELHRYFLHAAKLRFEHPVTGKPMEFHSPLPAELQKLDSNSPCLLLILTQPDAEKRWVLTALP